MKQEYHRFYKDTREEKEKKRRAAGKRNRARQRMERLMTVGIVGICAIVVIFALIISIRHFYLQRKRNEEPVTEEVLVIPPLAGVAEQFPDLPITEEFLTVNPYSRPGLALSATPQYIVIHYTANPGSTARENRKPTPAPSLSSG